MRQFKIGDKVKIPSEPCDYNWISNMNSICGEVGEVVSNDNENSNSNICIDFGENVWFFSSSYLLTEPYNQSEQPMEIDLEKEQIFSEPLEGYEFRFDEDDWVKKEKLKATIKNETGVIAFLDEELCEWTYCRKIQETPKPKTRPLTHFEILKMDAVFRAEDMAGRHIITNDWSSEREVEKWGYCLKSDLQKAQSLEDVVWKPLTTEEP